VLAVVDSILAIPDMQSTIIQDSFRSSFLLNNTGVEWGSLGGLMFAQIRTIPRCGLARIDTRSYLRMEENQRHFVRAHLRGDGGGNGSQGCGRSEQYKLFCSPPFSRHWHPCTRTFPPPNI